MKRFLLFFLIPLAAWADDEIKPGFSNESAVGYVVTGGNSQSETTSIKQNNTYRWDKDILKFQGHYLQAEGQDQTTGKVVQNAENWSAAARFEKIITPKQFSTYFAHGWYGDRFQNVSEGNNTDIGGKYFWISSESTKFFSELGYRYTRELLITSPSTPEDIVGIGNPGHPEYHYLYTKTQIDYTYNKTLSLGAWIEYIPSITDFKEDQRINFSPYLTSVLTDIFSLKVAYESRYRSKPAAAGNKLTDYTFTTSLIAKF